MKVYNFEDFMITDKFISQVVEPFGERSALYQNVRKDNKAMVFVQYQLHIYVFLKYVPQGEHTVEPTVEQSFQNIQTCPRISSGEWVVEGMYKLQPTESLSLYPLIYAEEKQENWFELLTDGIKKKAIPQSG